MHDVPFVINADFECYLKSEDSAAEGRNIGDNTRQFQKHEPSGYCYLIKFFDDNLFKPKLVKYTKKSDEDVSLKFVESLENNIKKIHEQFKFPKKIILREKDKKDFEKAKKCYACDKKFEKDDKVKDHCHYTGKYRGAACISCNSKMKKPKFVPVIFHNLQNYDSHLFIKNLGVSEGEINCIPNTEEKYISFTKEIIVDKFESKKIITEKQFKSRCKENIIEYGEIKYKIKEMINVKKQIRFIDSFKFMQSSLGNLVKNLDKNELNIMKKFYKNEEERELLTRKGVFPYDWFDNIQKLNEEKLPDIEEFYSKLNDENITEEDYEHAQKVWKRFKILNMREYHNLYLKTDVILLADGFENFRKVCKENYKLDPAWYYTSPGLSWDAMLKMTRVELELLSDSEMYLMIENGIRGGVSTVFKRYAKANNLYMESGYDPKEENVYIQYLDANNLYSWAMSRRLPVRDFKWMNEGELQNWKSIPCILEVDLKYPEELHDEHNDYPLAPGKMRTGTVEKLVPNLYNKKRYVLHYENLKLYESLGLKITKIHTGIRFYEEDFMKSYIDKNTELRKGAKSDFQKDFYKLMNNSVFGKTMENIRNWVNIQLCSNGEKSKKLFSKTNFDRCTIFSENLIAVHMYKTKIILNKPMYLGMSILDLSKTLMYDFYYIYIKKKYGDKVEVLLTNTDSLLYKIYTEDFYKDIISDVETMFDTSNYPKEHPSGIPKGKNKK